MQDIADLAGIELQNTINSSQFDERSARGFYESYFLRANHSLRPLAFWIRYTLFSPKGNLAGTEGQLWAIYFDGEASAITAIKQTVPFSRCSFSQAGLEVRIGQARLNESQLTGSVESEAHRLSWDLAYAGHQLPAFLLPLNMYSRGFPKAKVLTSLPLADFSGVVNVDGHAVDVSGWRGSQNHNWGLKHTDMYAWGQVAGFDTDSAAFLECSTARMKIGPFWTPWLSNLVLRLSDREIKLNSLPQAVRNRGRYGYFHWTIECNRNPIQVSVTFSAPSSRFVALAYDDPAGQTKTCLNTKLATCHVRLTERGKRPLILTSGSRAAFEILTTSNDHGIPISA